MKLALAISSSALLWAVCSSASAQLGPATLPYQPEALWRWNDMAPRDVFVSDEILEASEKEIATLNLRVAEALARALADCTSSLSEDERVRNECDRARAYFDIVSAPRGPLGLLSAALNGTTLLVRLNSRGTGTSKDNAAHIDRIVKIEGRWKNAVRRRLQELDRLPR